MKIAAEPFRVAKRGNLDVECEDAVWPDIPREYDDLPALFAIADGATESAFSRVWASKLVAEAARVQLDAENLAQRIQTLRTEWHEWLSAQDLPWFLEAKAHQGTFAALVTLQLFEETLDGVVGGRWRAEAVGDSCLFQLRSNRLLVGFPIDNPRSFSNTPHLLGTNDYGTDEVAGDFLICNGAWTKDDTFMLMTDALACWFLHAIEGGDQRWCELCSMPTANGVAPFAALIDDLRDEGAIRNDDCTLLRIHIQ